MREKQAAKIKWISILIALAALFVIVRQLPVDQAVDALQGYVNRIGIWGPVVFGLAYVIGAVLFFPGSALTLAAGAVFGLLWGTVTVSIASTTAAAIAFLIARYLAREAVAKKARQYPRFSAIDRAISEGGWKVIALLRLSPLVPFSIGNYLFGLTGIRFVPYVLASWIAMLPGTFMYVYFGYLGRVAAAGGERGPWQLVLLVVGLLATVAVTVYITRLALNKLKEQTQIEVETVQEEEIVEDKKAGKSIWVYPAVALVLAGVAVFAVTNRATLSGLFGPPPVELQEAYADETSTADFDHSILDELLKEFVDADGYVDYPGLRQERAKLQEYINALAEAPFDGLGRDQKLALLINAYNAFTLELILEYYPLESIRDIPVDKRWKHERWNIGGNIWSLDQIEHEQIRPKFAEPRIHFAVVCAAIGCPPLRTEAYGAERLDAQLESQTVYVHHHDRWFVFDPEAGEVGLTKLYDWYGGDFEQSAGSVLDYVKQYSEELAGHIQEAGEPDIRWLEYDWTLNSQANRGESS